MDTLLAEAPKHKKILWGVARYSWIGTALSAMGFAYIAVPAELQASVRGFVPVDLRVLMLGLLGAKQWLLVLLSLTVLLAIWGAVAPYASLSILKNKFTKLGEQHRELRDEHDSLQSKYDERLLDCYQIFSDYIYIIFRYLKLTSNERISIYRVELGHFRCIGRYSLNESFKSKPDRMYSKSYGYLAKAWEQGGVSDATSPCPKTSLEEYIKYHTSKFGVPEDVIRNSNMKSRAFCAIRILDTKRDALAVIVFESTNSNGLPFSKINRCINDDERRKLSFLMEGLSSHMVSLEIAHKEGF